MNLSNSIINKDQIKIGCVVPCFKGGNTTLMLIDELRHIVDLIILVDDSCPFSTGVEAKNKYKDDNIMVIFNEKNLGVGASTIKGFNYLISQGCGILIKIDADYQMDPYLIPELIKPIQIGRSEAAKGNRFTSADHIIAMPLVRIIGNLVLSFLNKLSTGYWELFDPTNGFIAFQTTALERVRLEKVDSRYFFESDLLFQCSLAQISFSQLPMKSIYRDEISSLRPIREIKRFIFKHTTNFFKRLIYQYFLLDFNAGSLELVGSVSGILLSIIIGSKLLVKGYFYADYATPGESSLFAIVIIVTMQMIIAFLYYDSTQQPLLRNIRK